MCEKTAIIKSRPFCGLNQLKLDSAMGRSIACRKGIAERIRLLEVLVMKPCKFQRPQQRPQQRPAIYAEGITTELNLVLRSNKKKK